MIELPRPLTGELRKDVELLWDALFRLTEELLLRDPEGISAREKEGEVAQ